jgi:putative molybdopterin biosynthesis protein
MTDKRNIYLKMKTLEEAKKIMGEAFPDFDRLPAENIDVANAVNRILSEPVYAAMSSPNYHAAAMDGIAVAAESTFGAAETDPKILEIGKEAHYINTGHVMPENTSAVIMIENVNALNDQQVEIVAPAFPWQNVRRMGEDIVATELVFPRNHKVTPYCLGALISAGVFHVNVYKKPHVFIQPTGSELVDHRKIDQKGLLPGQVLDSNSHMLGKLVDACGGSYFKNTIIEDQFELIAKPIKDAAAGDYDMIFISGGSSAGSKDFTREIISKSGEVLIHGVTMMPGKPVIVGKINEKPIFGIPGYPVSAIIAFEQLVRPLINRMLHQPDIPDHEIQVMPTKKIPSKLGLEEFLRVKLGNVGGQIVATPLPRGAGCITSFTEADGIIRIPNHIEGIAENKPTTATLLRPLSTINHTIVAVGSHDNTMDVLADLLRAKSSQVSLSSSHVGSMGGLMAIKKGLAHVAGTHLLNPDDGSYNISYIQKYLPDTSVKLVHLVQREQGLIIAKNNPKDIKGIEDLTRKDISFINRQSGSGTRILLDFKLSQMGLNPSDINGYLNEEFTHMAVAVAVLGRSADAGLGIYAAAKALSLDFIPVVTESYDLVIPADVFDTENITLLMEIIRSEEFKSRVNQLGGYHTQNTGEIIWSS